MTDQATGTFKPRLEILPPSQRALWNELDSTPEHFTLYGGTALALRLGHRTSIDFDFFSDQDFEPDRLAESVAYLKGAERVQVDSNTLTCRVERGGPVLVSFFGGLNLGIAAPADRPEGSTIMVASLLDVAATKMAVVQKRAEVKDYIDVYALLQHGLELSMMLSAAIAVHGQVFNPMISLKALGYFDDLQILPTAAKDRLRQAVAAVDPTALPRLVPFAAPRFTP